MSLARAFKIMGKDLRMGPRSSVFAFGLVMPFLIAFLLRVVFLTLFDPAPRLGIVDLGDSEITAAVEQMEGIDLTMVDEADELLTMVENNDVDAGIVLPAGFDEAVRAGERPELQFHLSGESKASNRIVLSVTALDLVREVEGKAAPVEVKTVMEGERQLPIEDRLVPFPVIYALLVAGIFVTAFSIVDEKVHHTLDAVLVTPVKMSEVLLGKGILGMLVGILLAYLTLLLTGVSSETFLALLAPLGIGALMMVEIGLIFGVTAKDANMLFTMIKSSGFLLVGPVIFYVFPKWPQWIAKLFPSYWFIDPTYRIAILGEPLSDMWTALGIGLAVCVALVPVIVLTGRRLQSRLAAQ